MSFYSLFLNPGVLCFLSALASVVSLVFPIVSPLFMTGTVALAIASGVASAGPILGYATVASERHMKILHAAATGSSIKVIFGFHSHESRVGMCIEVTLNSIPYRIWRLDRMRREKVGHATTRLICSSPLINSCLRWKIVTPKNT